ncbi:NAD(P)-dependent dehydrogenase (short-subunit alcohol dehydrogenase family) [Variovorax paradoxus]|uniref:NAD(P)-dependent dehydrogenase (Short-subunit alcohol dehydrogenase family) n=1 Tax=Variovorax paradoxus TaxID=34073 RepID=A0AAW8EGQ4_VARPD|nr:NAD(P)-dependent dehydrogenase (short-subunit alcohol dehydrogenase family) [Variovorax paradoxus]
MDLQLDGKLALVSGSTAGIGFAIARTLAQEGASVIVNGRSQPAVDEAVDRIRSETQGTVLGYAGDLGRADAAEEAVRRHPGIGILVNNLGIFEAKAFEDIPDEDWQRFFDINVLSGVRLARLVLPEMKRTNWGRIIFISSESAVQIPTEMIHYGMTKTAQLAVSRGLAESLAGTNITVNSVLPGPTRSRGVGDFVEGMARSSDKSFEQVEAEFFDHVRPTSLIKRFASPQEVASLVATWQVRSRRRPRVRPFASTAASSRAPSDEGAIEAQRLGALKAIPIGAHSQSLIQRSSRPTTREVLSRPIEPSISSLPSIWHSSTTSSRASPVPKKPSRSSCSMAAMQASNRPAYRTSNSTSQGRSLRWHGRIMR